MHRTFTLAFLALALAVMAALPAGGRAYEPGLGKWVKLIFSPQAGYSSACLTCGWHGGACTSPSGGSSLDFAGACTGSQQVYLRVFGFLPSGTPNNYVGYAHYSIPPAWDCKEVDALIRDTHGNLLGTMRYVHTENPWPQFIDLFASGGANGYLNEQPFVQMASDERNACKQHDPPWWTGVHVHEEHVNTGNTPIFLRDGGACAAGCGAYPCAPNPPDGSPCYYNPHDLTSSWTRIFCINDTDCDGWTDGQESYIGTDAWDACPDGTWDNAWPPDMNNNRTVNILDVLMLPPHLGCSAGQGCYSSRFDLTTNGTINILDVLAVPPSMGRSCT